MPFASSRCKQMSSERMRRTWSHVKSHFPIFLAVPQSIDGVDLLRSKIEDIGGRELQLKSQTRLS
eukprot:7410316-Karenia_brevis.AAC.1